METTRRRFLFGLGATGALIATPIPVASALEGISAPRPLTWLVRLEVVGEMTFSERPSSEALPFDAFELRQFVWQVQEIDVTPLDSEFMEFVPGRRSSWLEIEGQLDSSMQAAMMADAPVPVSFPLPSRREWISTTARIREMSVVV